MVPRKKHGPKLAWLGMYVLLDQWLVISGRMRTSGLVQVNGAFLDLIWRLAPINRDGRMDRLDDQLDRE
jgi:hypothetical protein